MGTSSTSPAQHARRGTTVAAGAIGGALAGVGGALLAGANARGVGVDVAAVVGLVAGASVAVGTARWRPGSVGALVMAIVVGGVALFVARVALVRPALVAVPVVAALVVLLVALLLGRLAGLGRGGLAPRSRGASEPTAPATSTPPSSIRGVVASVFVSVVAAVVYAAWSVERHARFGSGSWDYGCYLHNAWLFAHGDAFSTTARSSVLGDVAFWGGTNHFMPSLIFTAPLAWWMEATRQTSALLVAQAVVVTAAAIPLALLARRARLGVWTTTGLAIAYLFGITTQAFLLFDFHEVAPVPLLLLSAAVVVTTRPPSPRAATVVVALLLVLAGCKESAIVYAAAVGAWMFVFVPAWRTVGAGIAVAMAVAFVVVTGVVQPALLEPGGRMIHVARFVALDDGPARPGLLGVLSSLLAHPGRALAALVTPDTKVVTLATSASTFGALSLVSGEALVLGLPNLVERFLSDKREMWGLGFHYGLVGGAVLALGALDTLRRLRRRLVDGGSLDPRAFDVAGGVFVVASLLASFVASPVSPELATYAKPYYANDVDVDRYRRALALVDDDDAVVAQNHFLPHVALREHVWLPEPRFVERADVVVLDPAASPWPHDRRHVERLLSQLRSDERFAVAFHEASTWVFRRR